MPILIRASLDASIISPSLVRIVLGHNCLFFGPQWGNYHAVEVSSFLEQNQTILAIGFSFLEKHNVTFRQLGKEIVNDLKAVHW